MFLTEYKHKVSSRTSQDEIDAIAAECHREIGIDQVLVALALSNLRLSTPATLSQQLSSFEILCPGLVSWVRENGASAVSEHYLPRVFVGTDSRSLECSHDWALLVID